MTPNEKAFLDMIAFSELGTALLDASDNGYNVIVGSTAARPDLFTDYSDHPRKHVHLLHKDGSPIFDQHGAPLVSTAAGRYQLLVHWFDVYKVQLGLPDFSPDSQDAIALQQIKECRALDDINAGRFEAAVAKCANIWASLPGAGYGQRENKMAALKQAYMEAGGMVTS